MKDQEKTARDKKDGLGKCIFYARFSNEEERKEFYSQMDDYLEPLREGSEVYVFKQSCWLGRS
jgi:hypothetical protein